MCPVYGIPPRLLEESIQCFLDQTHPKKTLLLFDDLGNIDPQIALPAGVRLITTKYRSETLINKYEVMLSYAIGYDAISLWDADDIYLPHHLEEHDRILSTNHLSYPNEVWSTYSGSPQKEKAGGRFWASLAIRTTILKQLGFINTHEAQFDQINLKHFKTYGWGSPDPTYVFRWGDTAASHGQANMKSPTDTRWYTTYKPDHILSIDSLVPHYQPSTLSWLTQLKRNTFCP